MKEFVLGLIMECIRLNGIFLHISIRCTVHCDRLKPYLNREEEQEQYLLYTTCMAMDAFAITIYLVRFLQYVVRTQ